MMANHRITRKDTLAPTNRSGATVVEFAVTAPVLFLVIFGVFDLFSAYCVQRTTDQGLYRATRMASLPGALPPGLKTEIESEVERLGLDVNKMVITNNDFQKQDFVELSVDVPLEQTSWLAPLVIRDRLLHLEYDRLRENFPKGRELETNIVVSPPPRRGFNLER